MFLVPLSPKETSRFPLFAAGLVLVNLLVFVVTWPMQLHQSSNVGADDLRNAGQRLAAVADAADSGLSDRDRAVLSAELSSPDFPSANATALFQKIQDTPSALGSAARYQWDLLYPVFESYQRSAHSRPGATTVFKRWGFNPDRDWWPGLVTHQFLHEGWVHLTFNLIFLWVAAVLAEEVLGGHLLWVYVAGGIAAALSQAKYGIPAGESLVGASGAISALMGFCLLACPRAEIKLFYLVFLPLPKYGVFDSPLWFFLPVWILMQLILVLATVNKDTVTTAYVAHLGGFVFGAIVGWLWPAFNSPTTHPSRTPARP